MKLKAKKGDIIIITGLLALALLLMVLSLIPAHGAENAIITHDGEQIAVLPLDTDTVYTVSDGDALNVIEVSEGRVRMVQASCPDGQCVHQGYIDDGGEVIVCLPNRVTVALDGESENAPDAIVG